MSKINDQDYLCNEQYKDASNLNARIRIHLEFSTNKYGWFRWVFDQYDFESPARILELGCGPGDLWLDNADRIPVDWEITLSDFSPGMLDQAKQKLVDHPHAFTFETIDAQSIPYGADHFDFVIANHFIYHVPDRAKALSEIRRVLKPGGRFYATTIGSRHMKELPELLARFDPAIEDYLQSENFPFTLENGADQLKAFFPDVQMRRYIDDLKVTDVNIMADYAFSSMRMELVKDRRDEFMRFLKQEMEANGGVITIKKDSGIFIAR
jgi:ubiquinone/menaquinone biosynthesis C-methylase UbiE